MLQRLQRLETHKFIMRMFRILIGMKRTCIVQGISIHASEALLVVSFRLSLMLYAQFWNILNLAFVAVPRQFSQGSQ